MILGQEEINSGNYKQGKKRADDHSGYEYSADAVPRSRTWTGNEHEQKVTGDGGYGSHQNWAKTSTACLDDRMQFIATLFLQLIGELDNQDTVL